MNYQVSKMTGGKAGKAAVKKISNTIIHIYYIETLIWYLLFTKYNIIMFLKSRSL